jgi:hypothetical protein
MIEAFGLPPIGREEAVIDLDDAETVPVGLKDRPAIMPNPEEILFKAPFPSSFAA